MKQFVLTVLSFCTLYAGAQTPFATENFGTGSYASLPTGWTAGGATDTGATGATWQWVTPAYCDSNEITPLFSPSDSNGFMMYNSDANASLCSCAPSGWLQSPAYNCSGHPTVCLNFANFFTNLRDSCFVWVSATDSTFAPGSYTSFPVAMNNILDVAPSFNPAGSLQGFTDNPASVHINISSVAANQPEIFIRFVYATSSGGYQWLIDDMTLTESPTVAAHQTGQSLLYFAGPASSASSFFDLQSFGSMPGSLMSQIFPFTSVNNFGNAPLPYATVSASIYKDSTLIFATNTTLPLAINDYDVIDMTTVRGFNTQQTGLYNMVFNCSSDSLLCSDTVQFAVTDSTYSMNPPNPRIMKLAPLASFDSSGATFQMVGTEFVMAYGSGGVLSSVTVALDSASVPGNVIGVHIYSDVASIAGFAGATIFKPITAPDISAGFAVFPVVGVLTMIGNSYNETDGGYSSTAYAAVVTCENCTGNVFIPESNSVSEYLGSVGYTAPSANDGDTAKSFAQTSRRETYTPMISLNFSNAHNGIAGFAQMQAAGTPYPDPADNEVILPVNFPGNESASVLLTDVTGRTIKQQTVQQDEETTHVIFETQDIAAGVYFLRLTGPSGQQVTRQFAIAH